MVLSLTLKTHGVGAEEVRGVEVCGGVVCCLLVEDDCCLSSGVGAVNVCWVKKIIKEARLKIQIKDDEAYPGPWYNVMSSDLGMFCQCHALQTSRAVPGQHSKHRGTAFCAASEERMSGMSSSENPVGGRGVGVDLPKRDA